MSDKEVIGNVITEGSIWRAIKILALPTVLGLLLEDLFNFTDMYFVGFLGPGAISAVSIGGIITRFIISGAGGLSAGTLALVSRAVGAGDMERANHVAMQSIIFGLMLSLVVGMPCFFLSEKIMSIFDVETEVLEAGAGYLEVIFLGSASVFLTAFMSSALRGAGDATTPMIGLGIGALANVFLDPIFIHGYFGFPAMGVAGSALATILTRIISVLIMLYALLGHRTLIDLKRTHLHPNAEVIKGITRIGSPSSLSAIIIDVSMVVMMGLVARYDTAIEAAYGISIRLNSLVTIPAMGFGFAAGAIIGQNLGAGKYERAMHGGYLILCLSLLASLPVTICFYAFPEELFRIFTSDPATVEAGIALMYVRFLSMPYLSIGNCLTQAINGSGDTMHPMIFSIVALLIVRVGIAYFLVLSYEEIGVWMALSLSNFLFGLLDLSWFVSGRWKHTKISM